MSWKKNSSPQVKDSSRLTTWCKNDAERTGEIKFWISSITFRQSKFPRHATKVMFRKSNTPTEAKMFRVRSWRNVSSQWLCWKKNLKIKMSQNFENFSQFLTNRSFWFWTIKIPMNGVKQIIHPANCAVRVWICQLNVDGGNQAGKYRGKLFLLVLHWSFVNRGFCCRELYQRFVISQNQCKLEIFVWYLTGRNEAYSVQEKRVWITK